MILHPSKKTCLQQCCHSISPYFSVSDIKDLADGKFLSNLIYVTFEGVSYDEIPVPDSNPEFSTVDSIDFKTDDNIKNEKVESADDTIIKSEDVNTEIVTFKSPETVKSDIITTVKPESLNTEIPTTSQSDNINENNNFKNEYVKRKVEFFESFYKNPLQRFKYVQKFIDERYGLESEKIISYSLCLKSDELELAKVAFFVLSEIVKHYVNVNNNQLQALLNLDPKNQEDLEQCFNYFISDRDNIIKDELEKILSNPAKYKVRDSPRSHATPQRKCKSVYKSRPTFDTPSSEEIFSNSPLKLFFDSPALFKKEDMALKDKKIKKLQEKLDVEELKNEELKDSIEKLNKKLEQKDRTIRQLRNTIQEYESEIETNKSRIQEYESEIETNKSRIQEYESEIETNESSPCGENKKVEPSEKTLESPGKRELFHHEYFAELLYKNDILTKELKSKEEEEQQMLIALNRANCHENCNKIIKELQEELNALKDALLHKEKLSECTESVNNELESIEPGENIGEIIEEEKISLMKNYKDICLVNGRQRKKSKKELNGNCSSEYPCTTAVSVHSSKMCPSVCKELNYSVDESFPFNSSDVTSELPVFPSPCEGTPIAESLHEISLKRCDSQSESDNTSLHLMDTDSKLIETDIASEKLFTSSQQEVSPVTEITSQAVLWKDFCSQPENQNTYIRDCMNVSHNLNIPKSMDKPNHVDVISGVESVNCSNVDNLNKLENIDMFKNVSFSKFFDSLKKLSPNGSYKKVIKVFEKLKSEPKLEKVSIWYDLQVLINIVTEYIADIAASHYNNSKLNKIHSENENETIGKQIHEDCHRKINIIQKRYLNEIDILNKENNQLDDKYKETVQEKMCLEAKLKGSEKTSENYRKQIQSLESELEASTERYNELCGQYHQIIKDLFEKKKELFHYVKMYTALQSKYKHDIKILQYTINRYKELNRVKSEKNNRNSMNELLKKNKELKDLVTQLRTRNKSLNDKIRCIKAVKENRNESEIESLFDLKNVKTEDRTLNQTSEFALPESSTALQETGNESILSGALYNKSQYHFVNHDEEDFLNHSSLADIQKDYKDPRVEELIRRNSLLPHHLQSSYPVEGNLPTNSVYVRNYLKKNYSGLQKMFNNDGKSPAKKRKYTDVEPESHSTPVSKEWKKTMFPKLNKKFLVYKKTTAE